MEVVGGSDSTKPDYWLNWRVLLCAVWVVASMVLGSFMIWKYEGADHQKRDRGEKEQESDQSLCNRDTWRPCIKEIHPIWLLVYRIIAFSLLSIVLAADIYSHGYRLFYFYTQWTFTMLTIYFGFGMVLSFYGCCRRHEYFEDSNGYGADIDTERGSYVPPSYGENTNISRTRRDSYSKEVNHSHGSPGIITYIFQVLFQLASGAVMLTDSVYWFIIFPLLTRKHYHLDYLTILMHSLNASVLLIDALLNSLRFPWFRVAYLFLWTGFFVTFQWIIHVCSSMRWPYPFMDLSSPYAPFWYLLVGVMHIPCYSIFGAIVRMKHQLLLKHFPQSYRCVR